MEIDTEKIVYDCINAVKEKVKSLKKLNIIVAGKTGVGKSTLINSVFRDKLADTGIGKPVTDHMQLITKPEYPLTIYDTKGFELGKNSQEEVKNEIIATIRNGYSQTDVNEAIHCIWYCISTTSHRIEQEEIDWIKNLSKENEVGQIPIIVILTQAFQKNEAKALKTVIDNENLHIVQIIPVLAEDYVINDEYTAESYGLDDLIKIMENALPDELIDTLHNVQIVSLEEKIKRSHKAVIGAASAAAATGITPIPFSDYFLLVPTQVAMFASITVIFGMEVNKSVILGFLSSTIGTSGATLLGKTVVANLVKSLPVIGTVGGAAISGTTAAILTTALGETYIYILSEIFKGTMTIKDLETKEAKTIIQNVFKEQLNIFSKNS